MPLTLTQIDAFADRPFAGNPAAVCLLAAPCDERFMQAVASEMNLSETAFLVRRGDGGFDLRWFTPAVEVDLCGHATLASAHLLWQEGHVAEGEAIRFHTRSGMLHARRGDDGWIELDFPTQAAHPVAAPEGLAAALGEEPRHVGANGSDLLVELADEAAVRRCAPDLQALRRLGVRGVIVTAAAEDAHRAGYDFVSRFFAPGSGIDEDPVTGSAHCALGPYWAGKLGRRQLVGYQASARGGHVRVRPEGERVKLAGQAVTVLTAELTVGPEPAVRHG